MSNWVTIQHFQQAHEAAFAKTILDEEGVQSFIMDEMSTQVMGISSGAIGGARLQVLDGDFSEASRILFRAKIITDERMEILNPNNYLDDTVCPFCGSENIDSLTRPPVLKIMVFYLLRIIYSFNKEDKCLDCNKHWKYKKQTT